MMYSATLAFAGAFTFARAFDPRHECLGYAKERGGLIGGTDVSVAQAFMPGNANGPRPINDYRPGTAGGPR